MEIFRHVYQIASLVADRNLFQYLFVGDNTILLDTGASYTPGETILPFLETDRDCDLSLDHGDQHPCRCRPSRRQCFSQEDSLVRCMLACGEQDRLMIEDPDRLFASRYNQWMPDHGVGLGLHPEASAWVRKMVGPAQRIDQTFRWRGAHPNRR